MRILHVTDTFYPKIDGIAFSILNTLRFQGEKNHNITILAPRYPALKEEISIPNTKIYRFRSFSIPTYKDVRIPLPDIRKIYSVFNTFQPHVVHVHTFGPICILSMFIAKRNKIPIVSTYHTYIPDFLMYASPQKLLHFERLVKYLERGGINKEKIVVALAEIKSNLDTIREKLHIKKHKKKKEGFQLKTVWAMTKLLYNFSDVVISPSESIKKELKKHEIKNVKVVSNGIELNLFPEKKEYNLFPRFVHIGRLGYEKKICVLIDAMAEVIKAYPDCSLDIIGDGPAKADLEAQVKKLNLEKNIKFFGYIERRKLPEIYRRHDIFVTASEMETQGLVLLEAMSCGLPVIGVNALAIPDVVHDQKTGYLVKKMDSKAMAEKMSYLIEHPELVKKMGKNARKEAEKHNLQRCLERLEKTYSSLR
jgi:glycosyltransferase involved in cell wall biosynthesis